MTPEQIKARAAPWLEPIPGASPGGEDARYDVEHEALRAEIGKLDNPRGEEVDWAMVVEKGNTLLKQRSKDVLIATHVAYALLKEQGIDGLVTGLCVVGEMTEAFWDTAWPAAARPRARASAITWLVERTALILVDTQVGTGNHDRIEALRDASRRLAEVVRARFQEPPAMGPLLESVDRLVMSLPARPPPQPAATAGPPAAQAMMEDGVGPAAQPAVNGVAAPAPGGNGAGAVPVEAVAAPAPVAEAPAAPAATPAAPAAPAAAAPAPAPAVPAGPTPEEVIAKRAAPFLEPCPGGAPAGSDARYEPDHEWMRTEVGKLDNPAGGAVDWEMVIEKGNALIKEKSKDILVASYVAFGLYEEKGLDGLLTGLALLVGILEKYWEGCFPPLARIRGRASAISFLVDRVEIRLPHAQPTADDGPTVDLLDIAARRFATLVREKFADQAPAVGPLTETVSRLKMNVPKKAPVRPPPPSSSSTTPAGSAAMPAATAATATSAPSLEPAAAPLADVADVRKFLTAVGTSLMDAGRKLRTADPKDPIGYRLLRAGLYLPVLKAPVATNGNRTALPPPPPDMQKQVEALTNNQKWDVLLGLCEGGLQQHRFLLELHRLSAMSLGALGEPYAEARKEVLEGTAALIRRLPEVMSLEYGDGTPFVGPAAKAWIASEVLVGGGGGGGGGDAAGEEADAVQKAQSLAGSGKGSEAVALLQETIGKVRSGRARFRSRLAMAQVCAATGAKKAARGLFAGLVEEADERRLEEWEPALAADLFSAYHACLRSLAKDGKDGTDVGEETAMVYRRLCRVDPAAALKAAD